MTSERCHKLTTVASNMDDMPYNAAHSEVIPKSCCQVFKHSISWVKEMQLFRVPLSLSSEKVLLLKLHVL